MKKLEIAQMEKIEGGKFWGTGDVQHYQENPLGGGWCTDCKQSYYFWIKSGDEFGCGPTYDC